MRKAGLRRLSKCELGEEYRDSVRQNIKQIRKVWKDWRRKSLNKCTRQEKKKEMEWAHPARRLTTKNGYRKNMVVIVIVS